MQRASEERAAPVGRRVFDEPRILYAADEGLECEVDLQAGERAAKADVDAAAPAEVLVVLAFGIELAWVGEADRVVVGGAVDRMTAAPAGMTVPPTSMSLVALRVGKN